MRGRSGSLERVLLPASRTARSREGTLTTVAHWGKRTLAYPVKKRDAGYYVVAQFEAAGDLLPEYERAVKLDEGVLRFLMVVNEGEPVKPAAPPAIVADELEIEEEEEV